MAEAIWAVLVESRECSLHDYMQFNGQWWFVFWFLSTFDYWALHVRNFFFSHDLWEDWIKTTRNTAIDRENCVPRGPQLYAIIAYLSQSVNICYFYVPIAHQRIWNCVWIRSRGGAERMIRVLCNACDTHIVWSLPTAQHRILLVLRTAAISELEQLYHYMYLLLCIVSPCKLTEWMSKYILCAV